MNFHKNTGKTLIIYQISLNKSISYLDFYENKSDIKKT